jgi:RecJ-like exonuclease
MPEHASNHPSELERVAQDAGWPALDVECPACRGEGRVDVLESCSRPIRGRRCYRCDGRKYIPTEFGEAVLALVGRWVQVKVVS